MTRCIVRTMLAVALVGFTQQSSAAPILFVAPLSGPAESPPNNSTATGFAQVSFDPVTLILNVHVTFSGLTSPSTMAHIHTPTLVPFTGTAGVATLLPAFPNFPLGETSGNYDGMLDMSMASSYNPAFITANGGSVATAEPVFEQGLVAGEAYLNIHTTMFPGGEIRGFLQTVPEPASIVMLGTGVLGIVAYGCRRISGRACDVSPGEVL